MAQCLKQQNKEATYFLDSNDKYELLKEKRQLKKQRERRAEEKAERKQKMADRRIQMIATGRMKDKKAKIRRRKED